MASSQSAAAIAAEAEPPAASVVGWLCVALATGLAVTFAAALPRIAEGEALRIAWDWAPALGVSLSFYLDGLSLLFALLISGIGAFVFLYSGAYMAGHPQLLRFYLILALFMLAMLGVVLADNLLTLYVFWELTTVTSYLLIGFNHEEDKSRRAALQGLLVTAIGGLALLAGMVLMGVAAGTYELSEILASGDVLRDSGLYVPILILILAGAFTKSAQFPFHFWLPNAMAAPTPVSAYLHSATMVKAGVYLLARLQPGLDGTLWWSVTLTTVGAITAVLGAVLSLRQSDLKLMLAYTTVMGLGTMVMFLGIDSPIAATAAVAFILVHALYKAGLFLVVGIIDHETGTRDKDRLGGLGRAMPITAAAAAVAALSMAGIPPLVGFISKELMYKSASAAVLAPGVFTAAALTANVIMVTVAAMIVIRPFFSGQAARTADMPHHPHEAPARMWLGPAVMAALGLLFGVAPWLIDRSLIAPGTAAVYGAPESYALALWHGINLPLLLSALTLALGALLYVRNDMARAGLDAVARRVPISGDRSYDAVMAGLNWLARVQTEMLQPGYLRHYLFMVFATLVLATGYTLIVKDVAVWPGAPTEFVLEAWGAIALILAGTLMATMAKSRLAAICALGTVGVGVALVFLVYGAPDLAKTQLLVETLVVVIVAIVMLRLPGFKGRSHTGPGGRPRDAVLAIGVGAVATVLVRMASLP